MSTKNQKLPPALVLDLSATGVAVARILAAHGVTVYGAEARVDSIGNYSKYIREPSFGYHIELNDDLLDRLIEFSRLCDTLPVLIPADDLYIEFIGNHYDVLSNYYLMQSSLSPDISPQYLNKKDFYHLCEEYGVPYPKTIFAEGSENIQEVLEKLRFPIILKPNLIHKWKKYLKGKKVMLVETKKELEDIFLNHKEILKDSMLQEVIPGAEDQLYLYKGYFSKDGKVLSSFTGRKIRQYPPDFGSASLAESLPNKDVEKFSIDFLEAAKFHGLCGSEFKYDERDNEYKMIEINIRPQLWEDLTRIADKQLVWTAYCDLAGIEMPEDRPQRNGVKWVYSTRDLFSALHQVRSGNVSFKEWIISYRGTRADALIDFSDFRMLLQLPVYTLIQVYKYKIKPWFQGQEAK